MVIRIVNLIYWPTPAGKISCAYIPIPTDTGTPIKPMAILKVILRKIPGFTFTQEPGFKRTIGSKCPAEQLFLSKIFRLLVLWRYWLLVPIMTFDNIGLYVYSLDSVICHRIVLFFIPSTYHIKLSII